MSRRAPLPNPYVRNRFLLTVMRAQAEAKFPHPANRRERDDWFRMLLGAHLTHLAMKNTGTRPVLWVMRRSV